MSKHGIRAFCLSLSAVSCSIALLAGGAQAANLSNGGTAGKFRVEGLTALSVNRTFTGQLEALTGSSTVHIAFLVPALNMTLLCASMDITEGRILSETEALLEAELLGCVVLILVEGKESESKTCQVNENAIEIAVKLLPKLHEGELYLLFEGDQSSEVGTVLIEGAKCTLPEEFVISGSAVALVKEGSVEQVTKLYTFSEPIQLLFQVGGVGDKLFVGGSEAFIDGNVTVSLTGSHILTPWSVI